MVGGPTGLSAMVELGRWGVACLLIEPWAVMSDVRPWAKTTSIRTMEHFRRWGLTGTLRAAAFLPVEWSQDIVFCVNLLGPKVARFTECFGLTTHPSDLWAETSQQVPQFVAERVLRDALVELPRCTVANGWRVERVTGEADGRAGPGKGGGAGRRGGSRCRGPGRLGGDPARPGPLRARLRRRLRGGAHVDGRGV